MLLIMFEIPLGLKMEPTTHYVPGTVVAVSTKDSSVSQTETSPRPHEASFLVEETENEYSTYSLL